MSAENRCVLFRGFAPTGRDSIAQGAALGDGPTNIGKPQRGVTPRWHRRSFAPLGLSGMRDSCPRAAPWAIELRPFGPENKKQIPPDDKGSSTSTLQHISLAPDKRLNAPIP